MNHHVSTRRATCLTSLVLALSPITGAAAAGDRGRPVADAPPAMRRFIERYQTDRSDLRRFHDVRGSSLRRERLERFAQGWMRRLARQDFDRLNQDGRVDYLLLKNHLSHELAWLRQEAGRFEESEPLMPFAQTIIDLEEARRRLDWVVPREAAATLTQMGESIKIVRKRVEAGLKKRREATGDGGPSESPPHTAPESDGVEVDPGDSEPLVVKKTVAKRTAEAVGDLRRTLEHWFKYHDGYQPDFSWWARKPYDEVDKTLKDYETFLRERVAGIKPDDDDTLIGDPIGREALLEELVHEMIPYSPEQLITLGERQIAWCERELAKAASELGFDDWHDAMEHVKTLHVEPGKQDVLIAELAREAIRFLDDRDLVTIPPLCRETWRIEMMSPRRQLTSPFFLYGGQHIIVSFPTESMTHDQKLMSMRGNNIHFSRAVVHHELIPGHHLQGFVAGRHRTHRRLFGTPFLLEGWALHWEMLLWDLDFPRGPEDRIGMLFWRMHRGVRIVVSLRYHLGRMQPEEMVDFLVERGGHERDNATSEVRRYIGSDYSPLYQCAYMLGALQLQSLHRTLVGSGEMTNRAFHDAVLRQNSIPVEMIRAGLLGIELTPDYEPNWQFAGDVEPVAFVRLDGASAPRAETTQRQHAAAGATGRFPTAVLKASKKDLTAVIDKLFDLARQGEQWAIEEVLNRSLGPVESQADSPSKQ